MPDDFATYVTTCVLVVGLVAAVVYLFTGLGRWRAAALVAGLAAVLVVGGVGLFMGSGPHTYGNLRHEVAGWMVGPQGGGSPAQLDYARDELVSKVGDAQVTSYDVYGPPEVDDAGKPLGYSVRNTIYVFTLVDGRRIPINVVAWPCPGPLC